MTRNFFLSAAAILPLPLMACGNSATDTAGQEDGPRQLMQASPANDLEQALINGLSATYPEDKPGIVVTVTKGDEVAAEIALGKANWEFGVDWTVDTTNTLYSTTKSMVVMALLELQRQGQLDMNDSVTDYLDDFPTYDHDITLAHLASHTSGLYEDEVLIPLLGVGLSDIPLTLDEMYELVLKQSVLSHQPGTYFSYSDTAMRVLARVIEKISGQSFSEAMDTLLFTPANMDTAYISAREPVRSKGRASSYYPEPMENRDETKEAYKILGTLVESSGDGAAVGTIQDFAAYLLYLRSEAPEGGQRIDPLVQSVEYAPGLIGSYRWSMGVGQYKGYDVYSHGGLYGKRIAYLPELDMGMAFITNQSDFPGTTSIMHDILDIVFESENVQEKQNREQDQLTITSVEAQQAFSGEYYEPQSGVIMKFTTEENQIEGELFGAGFRVIQTGEKQFQTSRMSSISGQWRIEEDGSLSMRQADWADYRPLLRPTDNIGEIDLGQAEGLYFSEDFGATYHLLPCGEEMQLKIGPAVRDTNRIHFRPLAEDFFRTEYGVEGPVNSLNFTMSARLDRQGGEVEQLVLNLDSVRNFALTPVAIGSNAPKQNCQ